MTRSPSRFVLAVLFLSLLASCAKENPPTPGGEPASSQDLVPLTTKVLDASARAALLGVDESGTLRFAANVTAERLAPDDVVASEPTAAAPYGLLRKVTGVRKQGDGTTLVDTVQARLVEAIHEGHLQVELPLEDASTPGALTYSVPKEWKINEDFGTGGKLVATGDVSVKGTVLLTLDISCDQKTLGVCTEIPDLNFKFMPSVEQQAAIKLVGKDSAPLNHRKDIHIWTGNPATWTFYVAGVPVTILPSLSAFLETEGTLSGTFEVSASQSFTGRTGFSYNSDANELVNLTSHEEHFSWTPPTFSLDLDAKAKLGLRLDVSLYGIGGGYGEASVGPHVTAHLNGTFTDPDFLWSIDGCLWTEVGLQCAGLAEILDYIDEDAAQKCRTGWGWQPTSACVPLLGASATSHTPTVSIESPRATSVIYAGVPVQLAGRAADVDVGDVVTCHWQAAAGDALPVDKMGPVCDGQATFSSVGARTLSLKGTDATGRSSTASITVNVIAKPVVIALIDSPLDGQMLNPSAPVTLSAHLDGARAGRYAWSVVYPTDATGGKTGPSYPIDGTNGFSWTPSGTLTFPSCEVNGYAKIVVAITDLNGDVWQAWRVVRLVRIC